MERVPQIVSERLKAAAPVVGHPDADALTAFSERSLPQAERNTVIDHLARCAECRETVALALPAFEPAQQTARPAQGGWLSWPVLRWGLIAAGVVAITSFGVMQYQRRSSMTAYNAPNWKAASKVTKALPTPPSSEPAEDHAKLQAPASSVAAEQRDVVSSNAGSAPASEPPTPTATRRIRSQGGQIAGTLLSGPRVQWQQNTNNIQQQQRAQQLRANSPSSPSGAADASAQSGALSANVGTPVLESQRIDQQPLQDGHADSKIERIKPAGTSITSKVLAPAFAPPGPSAGAQLDRYSQYAGSPGVPLRWTITSAGGLQRSLDQGRTWQEVDVNNSPPAAASMALMKTPSRAKEVPNERVTTADSLVKDKESLASNGPGRDSPVKKDTASLVFRAVASNGPEVWAGAAGGLLYHSSDAGAHWTRVVPSASGTTLTGDILSLEFIDPQHGRIVTSSPEVWTTSDAGQSWQKQ